MRRFGFNFALLIGLLIPCHWLSAEDWPCWLGPRGDGISQETGLAQKWPDGGPKVLWSVNVGPGYASPIAIDGKIYMFASENKQDVLYAIDAESGKTIWKQGAESGWRGDRSGTRATPIVEGDRIYTYGGMGDLIARNLADGKSVWQINIIKATGGGLTQWGQASSPLIDGNIIYVEGGVGGPAAVAVDKTTGKVAWRSQAGGGAYAHPILINVNKTKQLVVFAQNTLVGMDPKTGKTIWSIPWQTEYDINAATPVYHDGRIFVTSSYGHGCMMVAVTAQGAKKLGEDKSMCSKFQPPILDGDLLFGNNDGKVVCIKWSDGKVQWEVPNLSIGEGGSLLRVGDFLIALNQNGKLSLVKTSPSGAQVVSQANHFVDGSEVWSMPLIYKHRIYVKGKDTLVCADIGAN